MSSELFVFVCIENRFSMYHNKCDHVFCKHFNNQSGVAYTWRDRQQLQKDAILANHFCPLHVCSDLLLDEFCAKVWPRCTSSEELFLIKNESNTKKPSSLSFSLKVVSVKFSVVALYITHVYIFLSRGRHVYVFVESLALYLSLSKYTYM